MILTYVILGNGQAIMCLECGMISFNPNDVRERYCGNCHEFHDHKEMTAAEAGYRIREHLRNMPAHERQLLAEEVVANAERIKEGTT